MMHEGPKHRNVVESVIADAISSGLSVSQGLNAKDAEDISSLYLEVKISLLTCILPQCLSFCSIGFCVGV